MEECKECKMVLLLGKGVGVSDIDGGANVLCMR